MSEVSELPDGNVQAGARAGAGSFAHTRVDRVGATVLRGAGPWTPAVHALLRHLEAAGFRGAPRVVGAGIAPDGRETLTYIPGETLHPGQPTVKAAAAVGRLIRELHDATASYRPSAGTVWQTHFAGDLGGPARVIGHRDLGPWNVVTSGGLPVAFIDWDLAGPIDPLVELAQACLGNANLYSDDIPERDLLPALDVRARQLGAMVDAYGLSREQRAGFFDLMVGFVVHSMAHDADEAEVTPVTRESDATWALAWQARRGAWLLRNRRTLEGTLA